MTVTTTARAARAQATHHPDVGRRSGAGPEAVASAGETATRRSAQHRLVRPRAEAVTAVIVTAVIANWFATLVHRPLPRSLPGFVRSDPKARLVIAYVVILITGGCPLAGSKVDELARQDAERAAERAEIVQAAIDEPLVREQPSLKPSR
jgi:hypothetical protein